MQRETSQLFVKENHPQPEKQQKPALTGRDWEENTRTSLARAEGNNAPALHAAWPRAHKGS